MSSGPKDAHRERYQGRDGFVDLDRLIGIKRFRNKLALGLRSEIDEALFNRKAFVLAVDRSLLVFAHEFGFEAATLGAHTARVFLLVRHPTVVGETQNPHEIGVRGGG